MLKDTQDKLLPVEVGTTVRLSIPDVDRARGSPNNILAVVKSVDNDLYTLCSEHGQLKHKYTRAEIHPCRERLLDLADVTAKAEGKLISLREAASNNSVSGSQGYKKCNCKAKCVSKKCACRANGQLCNSKCHSSLPCSNK